MTTSVLSDFILEKSHDPLPHTKIECANGGVLFLDEIGNMPLTIQQQLLRLLEQKTFTRVGGTTEIDIDFVLICGTNTPLQDAVSKGTFRSDLFYRINQFTTELPALTAVPDVLPTFIDFFAALFNEKYGTQKILSPHLYHQLIQHPWPGNIRELKNTLQTIVALDLDDIQALSSPPQGCPQLGLSLPETLRAIEKQAISTSLKDHHYHIGNTASALGLKRTTLQSKLKSLSISVN